VDVLAQYGFGRALTWGDAPCRSPICTYSDRHALLVTFRPTDTEEHDMPATPAPAATTADQLADLLPGILAHDSRRGQVVFLLARDLKVNDYVGNGSSARKVVPTGSTVQVTYSQGATNAGVKVWSPRSGKFVHDLHTGPRNVTDATGVELRNPTSIHRQGGR
jgi:hypothetical protein